MLPLLRGLPQPQNTASLRTAQETEAGRAVLGDVPALWSMASVWEASNVAPDTPAPWHTPLHAAQSRAPEPQRTAVGFGIKGLRRPTGTRARSHSLSL